MSKASKHVAQSTTEAEYMACNECVKELSYEIQLLKSLGLYSQPDPVVLYGDNEAALKMLVNEGFSDRSKHIMMRYHAIREKIKKGWVQVKYVSTINNVADIFTKGITMSNRFSRLSTLCSMTSVGNFNSFIDDWIEADEPSESELPNDTSPKIRKGKVTIKQGFKPVQVSINDYLQQQQEAIRLPKEEVSDDECENYQC